MSTVESEITRARQNLLDLTMRNRLLNYRPSKVRSIRIVEELPSEVYGSLVLKSRVLEVKGTGPLRKPARDQEIALSGGAEAERVQVNVRVEEWRLHQEDDLQSHHTDRYLQTPYDDEVLAKRLFKVYHEGNSALEEQGYTIVFLAIGFLEWYEAESSQEPRRAPLILIPVELQRVKAGDFSKLKWTEEEVFANISLAAKLVEHGVVLPPFEAPPDKNGIDAWLQQVVEVIRPKRRWRVLSEMALDFFSFTKFVMFKDLDPATWPEEKKPGDHPLLRSLFMPEGAPPTDPGFDEREIDDKLMARDLWHVMDADPSQIAVMEDVKAGGNLVVQGPPGTGKSQTITNLIGEALAKNKSVLFVSEKMAALEVVKSRLDAAGLGPFCLEIHSRKANKKALLDELEQSLHSQPPARSVGEQAFDEHQLVRGELNRYASELRDPIGKLGLSPYQLLSKRQAALAILDSAPVPEPPLLANALNITATDETTGETALRRLESLLPLVQPLATSLWRNSSLEVMLPHEERETQAEIGTAVHALETLLKDGRSLAALSGVQPPSTFASAERAMKAAALLASITGPTETNVLLSNEWNAPNQEAEELLRTVETLQREREALSSDFTKAALDGDNARAFEEFAPVAAKMFRIFSGRYRALRKQLAALYLSSALSTAEMVVTIRRLVEYQRAVTALRKDTRGAGFFGHRWRSNESDVPELRTFAQWLIAIRSELMANVLSEQSVELMASRLDVETVRTAVGSLSSSAANATEALQALFKRIAIEPLQEFGKDLRDVGFDDLLARLRQWHESTPALFRWSQYKAAESQVLATVAGPLAPLIAREAIPPGTSVPFFQLSLAESLLREAYRARPMLAQFVGELHEKKIERFRQLDADLVKLNRSRLSRALHQSRPMISGGASKNSEAGILMGELNRKRGHMAIRKLLANCGSLIQKIKPCFLMSPLSVAQFLDPRSARFDLIVFDEASQVRPEDAVGALLRGSQLVVMGDTQQLPPTSFFDHLVDDDVEEAEEEADAGAGISDVESILHQCARSYPSKTLNWHYRSRHESLIAVSNLHFYSNRLRIYPSAVDMADEIGLHFRHLPEGVYDRGKSATNRVEAKAIAEAAVDHYRNYPSRSLGIGTFNIKQQQAILEEIEEQLRKHPEMEQFFASDREEHFFVKNLETIQGDERDVIFISMGYGRDANGRLSLNFGPLNREGGERRLNVLISRARQKSVVFSNFTSRDLPLENSSSKGLHALKSFLEFAETRRLASEELPLDDYDSPFEEAVAEVLRGRRYQVKQQVGCAGFRVDLAVVHPQEPGRYVLGIECDGAKYHSSPVARDRDRLREQVLVNLGWTIHRIWSTDWYRNQRETIQRLIDEVERAIATPRASTGGETGRGERGSNQSSHPREDPPPADSNIQSETESSSTRSRFVLGEFISAPEYVLCPSLSIPVFGELHEVPPESLALAVQDVVRVEGPIHLDEVVRRIRTFWGLQRAGNRIRDAIDDGIDLAITREAVVLDGLFLSIPNAKVFVRRRTSDPPPRIELISDAEIRESIKHVLRIQFSSPVDDVVISAARRFGLQSTSQATSDRIRSVIQGMIGSTLVMNGGRVDLVTES